MEPEFRYCTSADGTRLSYSTLGDKSSPALVFANGWVFPQEWAWQWGVPAERGFEAGLAEDRLIVRFDRRGAGSSQRQVHDLSLDAHVADIAAVADAVTEGEFDLFGISDGTLPSIAFAARFPDLVGHLILWGPYLRAESTERMDHVAALARIDWGLARRTFANMMLPDGPADTQRRYGAMLRESMAADMAARYMTSHFDVSELAVLVKAPTLVLQPEFGGAHSARDSQMVAERIAGSRLVFAGDISGDPMERLAIVRDFLGIRPASRERHAKSSSAVESTTSATAIILFADIADSTALTEQLGDAAFRDRARELDTRLRALIIGADGVPIEGKLLGDGVLATFPAASQAIEAALRCASAGESLGLRLHLGIHAGDVIREANNVYGGAVNIASRISGISPPGELLVSDIVRGLARTSSAVIFEDHGEHRLKGVSDAVRVFKVRASAGP
jgi:class 3 adenylate cyclase